MFFDRFLVLDMLWWIFCEYLVNYMYLRILNENVLDCICYIVLMVTINKINVYSHPLIKWPNKTKQPDVVTFHFGNISKSVSTDVRIVAGTPEESSKKNTFPFASKGGCLNRYFLQLILDLLPPEHLQSTATTACIANCNVLDNEIKYVLYIHFLPLYFLVMSRFHISENV